MLALLAYKGYLGGNLRWILATGRLGLDGTVFAEEVEGLRSLVTSVTALVAAGSGRLEHMFEVADE